VIKLKKLLFLFTGVLLTMTCTINKKTDKKSDPWSLELEKGGCLDVCQAFTITITSNGKFKYNGKFKVKHLGLKTGTLNSEEQIKINRLLNSINWQDIKSGYGSNANSLQLKVLEYSAKTIKKKVSYSGSEPQQIKNLEHYIDTIINKDEL